MTTEIAKNLESSEIIDLMEEYKESDIECEKHKFVAIYDGYSISHLECLNCPKTKPF